MKFFQHLHTINHHKRLVLKYCFKVGLYWQGIFHDMSKYSPTEFLVGIKYYQGNRSPNDMERRDKGLSTAWLHHKGRNKHHLEYWIDYSLGEDKKMVGMEMPINYVVEMFCDRIAACRTYNKEKYKDGDPFAYFMRSREIILINPDTAVLLEDMLLHLKDYGEEETFKYIKKEILKKK